MDFTLNSLNQAAFQNATQSRNASHSKNRSTGVSASLALKAPDTAAAIVAEEKERTTLDLGQAFKMYNSPNRKTKSYFKQSGEELRPNKPNQTTAPRSGWQNQSKPVASKAKREVSVGDDGPKTFRGRKDSSNVRNSSSYNLLTGNNSATPKPTHGKKQSF